MLKKLLLLISLAWFGSIYAEEMKLAIIDIDKVIGESLVYKNLQSKMEKKNAGYQNELKQHEDKIIKMDAEIVHNTQKLSNEELQKKKVDLERQEVEAQQLLQKRRNTLESAFAGAMDKIRHELHAITSEIAKKERISVFFPKSQTIYSADSVDYTNVIIKQLNEKIKDVDVTFAE